ncbi:MAG: hypothetical protein QXW28_01495, partial [Nitrososphaerota archaeon]
NLLVVSNEEAQSQGVHAGKMAEELTLKLSGRAGGQPRIGQGTLDRDVDEEALRLVVGEILSHMLGEQPT